MIDNRRPGLAHDRLVDALVQDIVGAPDEEVRQALTARGGRSSLHETRRAIETVLTAAATLPLGGPPERDGDGGPRPEHATGRGSS